MAKGQLGGKPDETGIDLLTMQQRRFFAAYVQKGTLGAAARTLRKFPSRAAATVAGVRFWKEIKAKVDVETLMESVGLSKVRIFQRLDEGLDAKHVKPFLSRKTGRIVEAGPYIDHPTRVKAAAEAAKIGGLVVERHEHTGPGGGPIQYGDTERAARVAALLHEARKRAGKK